MSLLTPDLVDRFRSRVRLGGKKEIGEGKRRVFSELNRRHGWEALASEAGEIDQELARVASEVLEESADVNPDPAA